MKKLNLEQLIQEVEYNSKRCRNCGELAQDHYWVYTVTKESWGNGYMLRCPKIKRSYYAKNKPE